MDCATTPSLAMASPKMPPPRRIFKPFRSPGVLISLRYQPPIWVVVLPPLAVLKLYLAKNASSSLRPLPWSFQAFICSVVGPKGTAQLSEKIGSLPAK